jgi:hypothetical protein
MITAALKITIEILRTWGPLLVQVGVSLKELYQFLDSHRDHPGLSQKEREYIYSTLTADPTTLGVAAAAAPVHPGGGALDRFMYYQVPLGTYPDTSLLLEGDVIWRLPDAKYYVQHRAFGLNPAITDGWVRVLVIGEGD